jgi:hypothetical protein
MWRIDKALKAFGQPMVSARLLAIGVHPLLHDSVGFGLGAIIEDLSMPKEEEAP